MAGPGRRCPLATTLRFPGTKVGEGVGARRCLAGRSSVVMRLLPPIDGYRVDFREAAEKHKVDHISELADWLAKDPQH